MLIVGNVIARLLVLVIVTEVPLGFVVTAAVMASEESALGANGSLKPPYEVRWQSTSVNTSQTWIAECPKPWRRLGCFYRSSLATSLKKLSE